jgi:hypothetical protein
MVVTGKEGAIMNKTKMILAWAVICLLLMFTGCGKDDDNPSSPQINVPAELVGTWLYESVTANGVPVSLALILEWDPGTVAARFTVGDDGSIVYEELDADSAVVWTEWGTFTVDGNTATILFTEDDDGPIPDPEPMSGTWSLNENQDELTLNTSYMGATLVFIAIRYQ